MSHGMPKCGARVQAPAARCSGACRLRRVGASGCGPGSRPQRCRSAPLSVGQGAGSEERVVSLADLLSEDGTGGGVLQWDEDDDSPAEPWEAQVARIAASTKTDEEAAQTPSLAQSMLASASQALPPPPSSAYSTEGGFTSCSAQQLCCELVADAPPPLVVDTSSADVYAAGHIPGAVNVPLEVLSEAAKRGALGGRDAALVVVGTHSQQANVRLRRVLGFTNVRCLEGSTAAWTALGLPLDGPFGDVVNT
jgi:rhodanese-related sulfurtransferase